MVANGNGANHAHQVDHAVLDSTPFSEFSLHNLLEKEAEALFTAVLWYCGIVVLMKNGNRTKKT